MNLIIIQFIIACKFIIFSFIYKLELIICFFLINYKDFLIFDFKFFKFILKQFYIFLFNSFNSFYRFIINVNIFEKSFLLESPVSLFLVDIKPKYFLVLIKILVLLLFSLSVFSYLSHSGESFSFMVLDLFIFG